ncbi:hypothetical protein EV702DRAFT_672627 [Suillus placidus]|uniref:Uncharacterized protein n=1 Tax=Suillus placidus TaxID=48579 RepID=A0A9P6ZL81_9AGAM|nr:hypothetical protein EV702DRAFT_672627 [Suillus placidus]
MPPSSLTMITAYMGVLVLIILCVAILLLMADPYKMNQMDGTRVVVPCHPPWKSKLHLRIAIITDPTILLLF